MIETTMKQAKRMIRECVRSYLEKDEMGDYCLPQNKQRPIYLEGPAGIGKTEIVKQVAEEEKIGFVSYSMTHHNRQSAIGLPAIVEKELEGEVYKATEYTMSEIVESIFDAKRRGAEEGILFADEVNCVSETLSAAMLQFLQNKTFGPHRIPEGWVIVTAGNPPEYNKSVRNFDAVTRDRLRIIHVKPDMNDWLEYAEEKGIHPLVIQYVRNHAAEFYSFQAHSGKQEIVTARGWEDLSNVIKSYERNGFTVDESLVASFIQNEQTAISFFSYYRTVRSLVSLEELEGILEGRTDKETEDKIKGFEFQKRWAVMLLLYSTLQSEVEQLLKGLHAHDARYQQLQAAMLLEKERDEFQRETEALEQRLEAAKSRIDHTLAFLADKLEDSREAELLVNMMLDNEYFQQLSEYCQLDSLVNIYEKKQARMESAKKEIRAWLRGA